jgi:threonine/homoserine/homoserine lactone efflux protein
VSILAALGLGLGLGIVTGMPLGVANIAIVDAATSGRPRFAAGLAIGGALADSVHSALAFAGVGRFVTSDPQLVRVLACVSAAVIIMYAIWGWRRRATPRDVIGGDDRGVLRGLMTGVVLTLPNPAALAAWVALAGLLWPDAMIAEGVLLGVGVLVGTAAWFSLLARWTSRIPRDHKAIVIFPRVALVVFVAIAAIGVARVI